MDPIFFLTGILAGEPHVVHRSDGFKKDVPLPSFTMDLILIFCVLALVAAVGISRDYIRQIGLMQDARRTTGPSNGDVEKKAVGGGGRNYGTIDNSNSDKSTRQLFSKAYHATCESGSDSD